MRGRRLLDYLAILPLGLPGTVMAVGILLAFIRLPVPIYGTIWILLAAYVARFIPLATRSANATFRQIDPSLEEAGRVTGASWWHTIRRILFPLSRPGLLVAFLLVFIPAFSELSATILLYTGGTETIAIAIYRLNDLGQLEVVSALAVFTIAVVLTLAALVNWLSGSSWTAGRDAAGARARAMAFIDIAGIDKRFGSFRALSNVDLAHRTSGEFITLLGPSGCGKTTMLRTLAGFLTPDSGTIQRGRPTCCRRREAVVPPEQRRMGMVFQNYAVWPHMSVFENVAFGLRIAKVGARPDRRARRARPGGGRARGPRAAPSGPALRRPAAARGARALAGGRAGDPAARRAAVQPRRQAARAHAHRAQDAAAAHRHHLRLRHARPGRSDGAVRPHRRVQQGAPCSRSARRATSTSARPTCSSPISWGW